MPSRSPGRRRRNGGAAAAAPPHRILTILEGESLLNDATALLIYRLAVGAVVADGFSIAAVAPTFLISVAGSLVAGPVLGWLLLQVLHRVQHIPSAIILQFVTTYGVWLLAEQLGLSAVLTMVCYAMTVSQTAPARTPAWIRIPTYAVWETVVFALNVLAFIFIGLQIRPILENLEQRTVGNTSPSPARSCSPSSSCVSPGTCPSMPLSGGVTAVSGSIRRDLCCGPPSAPA